MSSMSTRRCGFATSLGSLGAAKELARQQSHEQQHHGQDEGIVRARRNLLLLLLLLWLWLWLRSSNHSRRFCRCGCRGCRGNCW